MISAYVVAAMLGCWKRESGVNPGIWESLIPCTWDYEYEYTHKGGYGLGQWTNVGTSNGRLYNLHTFVTDAGYADGDLYGQLEFVIHEGYWSNSNQTRGNYTSLDEFLSTDSTNLPDLVWDFLANWEGVPGNHYQERLEAAEYFLGYIALHQNDNRADYQQYSYNGYMGYQSTEQLNNVMLAYWYYYDNYHPSPPGGNIPIWLLFKIRDNNYFIM